MPAEAARPHAKQLREQADSSGGGGGGGRGGGSATGASLKTQVFEHTFETPDGTDADTSVDDAELERARREAEEQKKREAEAKRQAKKEEEEQKKRDAARGPADKYHVICSLGGGMYVQWQSRVVGPVRGGCACCGCLPAATAACMGGWLQMMAAWHAAACTRCC